MALTSKLFAGDPRLEACALQDSAHVTRGARGEHVGKIQQALNRLDSAGLDEDGVYGQLTAAAVLRYKRSRSIINRALQTQADDIVGKMTIASLDAEVARAEQDADKPVCILRAAPGRPAANVVRFGVTSPNEDDERKMQAARAQSLVTLGQTIRALQKLQQAIVRQRLPFGSPLDDDDKRVLKAAAKWLAFNENAPVRALPTLAQAIALMQRNIGVRNAAGLPPEIKRTRGLGDHAVVRGGSVENGVECGDIFFTVDGPIAGAT